MVYFVQRKTLAGEMIGPRGEENRRIKLITPESVGAENVSAEIYELASGASSEIFREEKTRQFFYVLRGQAKAEMGNLQQRVRAGHGIYAESGEACRFTDCSSGGFEFIRFTILPGLDQGIQNFHETN